MIKKKLTRKQRYMSKLGMKVISGRKKMFVFTMDDMAILFDVSLETMRNYIYENKVDPENLRSICEFYVKRKRE